MPIDPVREKLAELGFQTDGLGLAERDRAILEALGQLESFRKPLFNLDPNEALRQAIIRPTSRASVLGDDALLLGYLIGAALKAASP